MIILQHKDAGAIVRDHSFKLFQDLGEDLFRIKGGIDGACDLLQR